MKNTKDIHIIRNFDSYFSITDAIEEMGFSYEAPVLENKVIEANKFIAERLQLPLAAKVCSFKKLRIVEGLPMCIEQIYVDYDEVPALPKTVPSMPGAKKPTDMKSCATKKKSKLSMQAPMKQNSCTYSLTAKS